MLASFERAIEIDGDYLENYVNYAEYYAKQKRDWDLFCDLLRVARAKGGGRGVGKAPVLQRARPRQGELPLGVARSGGEDLRLTVFAVTGIPSSG